MTVSVPASVASVTVHAAGPLALHTHTPGDRPDLDGAERWAISCSPVCERGIVSGFGLWADGDARAVEGDGRVYVYVTVPPDEAGSDPAGEPTAPILNVTLPSITVNVPKQKRQKRAKVTVHSPDVHVAAPVVNVEAPSPTARTTRVRRRKDGTMEVESLAAVEQAGRG